MTKYSSAGKQSGSFSGEDDGKQMSHEKRWTRRCRDAGCVWGVLIRERRELQTGSQCAFVCRLTYEAVRVLGAQAAAGTFTMAAVADVRPEASTVTLLCTHRLSHCPGKGEKEGFKGLAHTCTSRQYHPPRPSCYTAGACKLRRTRSLSRNKIRGFGVFKGWTSGFVTIRSPPF